MAPAPTSASHPSPARWLALPGALVVVAIGVWITGGVVTDDETVAKGLTGLWLLLAGVISVAIAWRRRDLAAPVLVGYGVAAVGLGGFLAYTSMVDQVVDEDVVVATSPSLAPEDTDNSDDAQGGEGQDSRAGNQLLARGEFVAKAHPTEGTASVVETADGTYVTLTDFVTDPGPDLKVYVAPKGVSVEAGVDLGSLKGNKGDQQYRLPESFDSDDLAGASVVIWCRAFTVSFGEATLSDK